MIIGYNLNYKFWKIFIRNLLRKTLFSIWPKRKNSLWRMPWMYITGVVFRKKYMPESTAFSIWTIEISSGSLLNRSPNYLSSTQLRFRFCPEFLLHCLLHSRAAWLEPPSCKGFRPD